MLGATRILQLHISQGIRSYGACHFVRNCRRDHSSREENYIANQYCLVKSVSHCMHGSDGFLAKTLEKTTSLAGKFSLLVNAFRKVGFLSLS